MPDRDPDAGHSARLLRGLIWAGVLLAPLAAVVVLLGQSSGSVRFAVLLIAVSVVLVGSAVLIRSDPVLQRGHVEERVAEEVEALRVQLRAEFGHAAPPAAAGFLPDAPPAPGFFPDAPPAPGFFPDAQPAPAGFFQDAPPAADGPFPVAPPPRRADPADQRRADPAGGGRASTHAPAAAVAAVRPAPGMTSGARPVAPPAGPAVPRQRGAASVAVPPSAPTPPRAAAAVRPGGTYGRPESLDSDFGASDGYSDVAAAPNGPGYAAAGPPSNGAGHAAGGPPSNPAGYAAAGPPSNGSGYAAGAGPSGAGYAAVGEGPSGNVYSGPVPDGGEYGYADPSDGFEAPGYSTEYGSDGAYGTEYGYAGANGYGPAGEEYAYGPPDAGYAQPNQGYAQSPNGFAPPGAGDHVPANVYGSAPPRPNVYGGNGPVPQPNVYGGGNGTGSVQQPNVYGSGSAEPTVYGAGGGYDEDDDSYSLDGGYDGPLPAGDPSYRAKRHRPSANDTNIGTMADFAEYEGWQPDERYVQDFGGR
ncbi:hypothetical protein GCM10010172_28310 [Paractinoplanes ferrugineus]|uniref:Uncharacterized protein n=1 Tax=Paractinoplanes ferrugineus TaxID=113564 RepID=A0A919IX52_9ACTN|nr:hypothetical protein [Actinoplanes ferrugineus]GIE08259.1 hypothetical protein Afe05nite_00990 [Actinoplanes ferrugineus]